jgi:hypothetical protein
MIKPSSVTGLLCLCYFIQPIKAQSSLVLSSSNALSGGPASLALTLSSPAGSEPAALEVTFAYPAGATAFNVSPGPALLAAGKSLNCAGSAAAYTCLATGMNSNIIANGAVGTVSFNPPGAATVSITIPSAMGVLSTGSSVPIAGAGAVVTSVVATALQCVATATGDTCTVSISGAAPAAGLLVQLSSGDPALSVPASVTIPNAAMSVSFAATANPVATTHNAQVTASLGSSTVSTIVSVSPPYPPLLQIQGVATEASGLRNGSAVTPTITPAGFTGSVVINGAGSVNFVPSQTGNGVYFLNCCTNTSDAYYKFSGVAIGNIFNTNQGQLSFSLQSRYTFAQRQANAASARCAFDVRDGNGSHLFYFQTQMISGYLEFAYMAGGSAQYYYVPKGTEDALFGSGVNLAVTMKWNSNSLGLYLNGVLVKSTVFTASVANWTAASTFDLGAYEYLTFGGYDASDDAIGSFTVNAPVPSVTAPVTVSIASPIAAATVSGVSTVSANASSAAGIAKVQFAVDGANLGSAVTGAGPSYNNSWNTATVANGIHTLSAIATDNAGNTGVGSLSVTVNNPIGPVISSVSVTGITSSGAVAGWSTNTASDSQANYGVTSAYGSESSLSTALATAHSVNLTGLASSTTYHYQVLSRDSQGNLTSSGDFQFTTAAANSSQPLFQLHADATEVSASTNGAIVTPSIGPPGFTGLVVSNGSGTVNFAPGQTGDGVYFLNCCSNINDAYYKFTGAALGNIFNIPQGQITFYLKSRYSFAQRTASASVARYAFDVRDGNGAHSFGFLTQVVSGSLVFNYLAGGGGTYYYVPAGTEDKLFGNGVILQVDISWSKGGVNLYLNDTLVQSVPYVTPTPNWTSASNFDLGAYEYFTFGGYDALDDLIDEFSVTPVPHQ